MRHLGRRKPWFSLIPIRRAYRTVAGLMLATAILSSACIPSGPTYPLDFFHEMHYTQMFKPGEPPRLSPPEEAVPITGRSPTRTLPEAPQLQNPLVPGPEVVIRGQEVFQRNCQTCHGPRGQGNGIMATFFQAAQATPPTDLTALQTQQKSDGLLFVIIQQGTGRLEAGRAVMPPFGNLITNEETWAVIVFIRALQQGTVP